MLHDFVQSNREELISRARASVLVEPDHGVPLFLTQLSETLRLETAAAPFSPAAIAADAAEHGRELLAKGCTLSQLVQDYGDLCQRITELAVERRATISPEEFHTLSRCIDTAIAEAVTEYGRAKEEADRRHRAAIAHDLRNLVHTALLSYKVLDAKVGASGVPAGALLGRSLAAIRDLADRLAAPAAASAGAVASSCDTGVHRRESAPRP